MHRSLNSLIHVQTCRSGSFPSYTAKINMYSKANYINRKSVKSNLKSMKSLFLSIEEIVRKYVN